MPLFEAKLFKEISQTKSISKAATHCGISQSAATQHVQEVERRLGLPLVDRSTRPLALTDAGKLYADFCREVLRREDQFLVALGRLKGQAEGAVRVASIYSIGLSEMSRLRQEFERRHPLAQLHVDYLRPDKIYEAVLSDHADLGLVSYPVAKRELAVVPWRGKIAGLIAEVVRSWDADTVAARLELAMGSDLQYIRMNGTLVGACVGCLLFLIARFAF